MSVTLMLSLYLTLAFPGQAGLFSHLLWSVPTLCSITLKARITENSMRP